MDFNLFIKVGVLLTATTATTFIGLKDLFGRLSTDEQVQKDVLDTGYGFNDSRFIFNRESYWDIQDIRNKQARFINNKKGLRVTSEDGYDQGTIGSLYGNYLLSVKVDDSNDNGEKWEGVYKRLEEKYKVVTNRDTSNTFKDKPDSVETIKSKCDGLYKLKVRKDNREELNYWKDLWSFCSILPKIPVLVAKGSESRQASGYLVGKKYKDRVLSTLTNNSEIWVKLNKKFFDTSVENIEGTYFRTIRINANPNNTFTLKKNCGDAYQLNSLDSKSTAQKPTERELIKYCSLES